MCPSLYTVSLLLLSIGLVNSWDIAITYGDQIEFYTNGTKTSNEAASKFRELTALAYDAVHNILIFVDKQNDNASIFSYHLANKKYQPLVKRKAYENIQGIAFDPVTSKLFWTDRDLSSIFWISLAPGAKNPDHGNQIKLDGQLLRAIAIDSCRGYMYWTNTNISKPSIERSRFDGSERKTIVDKEIYMPVSISVDQRTGRIYWADDKEGIHYSIESSKLDGTDRKMEHQGLHHQPNSLTVSKDYFYWIEWGYNSVWRLPKTRNENKEPESIFSFQSMPPLPFGIVANYKIEDQTLNVHECRQLREMSKNETAVNESFPSISKKEGLYCLHGEVVPGRLACKCSAGYSGDRCEVPVCHNYCLHGDCSVSEDGLPICRCKNGYSGVKCESNSCTNYCLNDGNCSVYPNSVEAQCLCKKGFNGKRCENIIIQKIEATTETSECNCTKDLLISELQNEVVLDTCDSWDSVRDPIIMVLGVVSALLCVTTAVLITKVKQLKRRPRIKKRIIVNKNVTPLTDRPSQCEITIENCCNMNICETPCFEPRTIRPSLMDAKPGKEEKKNLIANMELPDDNY